MASVISDVKTGKRAVPGKHALPEQKRNKVTGVPAIFKVHAAAARVNKKDLKYTPCLWF